MSEANGKLRWVKPGILALMLGSACFSASLDIQRRFVSSGAIDATRRFISTDQTLDDAGKNGPVGLQFLDSDEGTRQFAYFRAVYDLYPQPVVIVNGDVVVFDATQIPSGIVYSEEWWRQHGVKTIVTVDQARNSWEAESATTTKPSEPE
ncbi:MAG TPA: hypothetical protein VGG44_05710 [Tepidisphaeraceae bacterium]|jgi:hypothetical protein